ncbi:MAG: hypothetical protein R3F59_02175 [Myxococcota bacterium]
MRWTGLWLGIVAGCSEYQVKGDTDPVTGSTTEETDTTDWTTTVPDEPCDGEDNDGDGQIDEAYPDVDGDGAADCVDDSCEVEIAGPGETPVRPECEGTAPIQIQDPWNVALEWSFEAGGGIVVSPVTGQLTDDNGDGQIDELDIPDVAFTS